MTKSTLNQLDYTKAFLQAANIPEERASSYVLTFWWNYTNTTNLRLSLQGINFIKKHTKIPVYTIELSTPLLSKHLITLSRICFCPYYIYQQKTILLLGQEEATMLTLHAGDLGQYLDNLSIDI